MCAYDSTLIRAHCNVTSGPLKAPVKRIRNSVERIETIPKKTRWTMGNRLARWEADVGY
jgi:hypothetical protein